MRRHVAHQAADEAWLRYQVALTRFGLIPEGFDLKGFREALEAEQLGGYYVPDRNRVVVVDKHAPDGVRKGVDTEAGLDSDTLRRALLVHEFTHALQFQNLDGIEAFRRARTVRYHDAAMARKALLEGDAMFVTVQYLLGEEQPLEFAIDAGKGMAARLAQADSPWLTVMASGPPALRDLLLFPYLYGMDFVARLLRERGWGVVDAAYAAPPVSTEQILHPSRYLDGERPMRVTIAGISGLLEAGYESLATGSWGELGVSLILQYARGASGHAGGWGGDVYHVLGHGDAWTVVWAVAWDRERDAEDFCRSWRSTDGLASTFPVSYQMRCRGRVALLTWSEPTDRRPELSVEALRRSVRVDVLPPCPPEAVRAAIEADLSDPPEKKGVPREKSEWGCQ